MILEYAVKNFRSLKDNIIFSMISANSEESNENLIYSSEKFNVLNGAVIYGANAAGKTNIIKSLSYLIRLIKTCNFYQPTQLIQMDKHVLLDDEPTTFTMHFIKESIRFAYNLVLNNGMVIEEALYYYPKGRQSKIFDRNDMKITFGEAFKSNLNSVLQFLKPNKLFLSIAANYSNVNEVINAFTFFIQDIYIFDAKQPRSQYSTDIIINDKVKKRLFINFLRSIGFHELVDIKAKKEINKIDERLIELFNEDITNKLEKRLNVSNVKLVYKKFEIDLSEESSGVVKLFNLFFPLIDIIQKDKILVCDEIEHHFHPLIVKEIFNLINNSKSCSQYIFTTHDTNILSLNFLRKDQIWFVNKEDYKTTLFSLSEIKGVRKEENFARNYLLGKYSAIPMIDDSVKAQLLKLK